MSMVVCSHRKTRMLALGTAAFSLTVLAGSALGQTVNETEPNESKATATPVVLTTAGDGTLGTINGVSTGSSTSTTGTATADYFKITVPAAAPGIYRYELQFPNVYAYTTSIRGLAVSSGAVQPGTDAEVQMGVPEGYAVPSSFELDTVFYAFGSPAQVYYRVTGDSSSTSPYQVSVVRSTVTPTVVPQTFSAGPITISTQATEQDPLTPQHTAFVVLDSNFAPVPTFQNDDATTAGGAPSASDQSYCTRTLPAGTYYVAVGSGDYGGNARVTADQPAPSDDGNQDKPVLDFPGVLAGEYEVMTPPKPANVLIADGCQTVSVFAASPDTAGLTFIRFTVGTPSTPCVALSTSPSPTMGMPATFYATVTPGSPPNNVITSVIADLSAFGGSAAQVMYNDGVTGGDAAIDNIWTAQMTLSDTAGSFPLSVTATDAGARQVTNVTYVSVALAPPSNDLCSNALVLSGLSETPTSFLVDINLATNDGVTLPCRPTTYNGIWYSYTPPASCLLSFNGAPYMAVFEATPGCGSLGAPLICDVNRAEKTHLSLTGGTPYLIYMGRSSASSDPNDAYAPEFSISFPATPSNDVCDAAIEVDLDDLPFTDTVQIGGANGDSEISACVTDGSTSTTNSIWYRVMNGESYCRPQITFSGDASVRPFVSGTYYTGPCSALQEVHCPVGDNIFVMAPNTEYYIHLFTTRNPGPGAITVGFIACNPVTHLPPANDHCDQAIVIPDGSAYTDSQFVASADRDYIEIDCGSSRPRLYQDSSIWYEYTPSQPVRALINETSTTTNSAFAVFSGSCGNLSLITCETGNDIDSDNAVDLEPCVTYSICMFVEQIGHQTSLERTINISLSTTLNGACQIGENCTYVASAAECGGTFMGAGSLCGGNVCCPADFNGVNGVTVQDIFDFLTAWLAGSSSANFNGVNGVTVQDIFDFLTAWLAGC